MDNDLSKNIAETHIKRYSNGGFNDIIDLVGESQAKIIRIFEQLSHGIVLCDSLSNVVWVSSKLERITGYSLQEFQEKGLELVIPPKHHDKHQRWVAGFHDNFRSMSDRGHIPIPCKDGSSFRAIIHLASIDAQGDEDGYRMAILQHQCEDAEDDLISKKIRLWGDATRRVGRPALFATLLLFAGFNFGRVLDLVEGALKRLDLIEEVRRDDS